MLWLFIPALLLISGFVYQTVGAAADRKRLCLSDRLVRCGNQIFHTNKQGSGLPVVVLEAGIAGTSFGWALAQPAMAEFTTVCSYDRAGLGWSGLAQSPRTLSNMLEELHVLISARDLPPPYILVGHSFGALLVRAFAATYPELTSALILVDPVSIKSWVSCSKADQRLHRGVRLSQRGAILARFGVVRAALSLLTSGSRLWPRLIGRAAAPRASKFMHRMVGQIRRLPPETWPIIQAHWSNPKSFSAMASYLAALPDCAKQAQELDPPAEIRQIILSAATATDDELSERDRWVAGRPASRHIRVPDSGHWIQLDQPNALVDLVRDVVETQRSAAVV